MMQFSIYDLTVQVDVLYIPAWTKELISYADTQEKLYIVLRKGIPYRLETNDRRVTREGVAVSVLRNEVSFDDKLYWLQYNIIKQIYAAVTYYEWDESFYAIGIVVCYSWGIILLKTAADPRKGSCHTYVADWSNTYNLMRHKSSYIFYTRLCILVINKFISTIIYKHIQHNTHWNVTTSATKTPQT